MFNNFLTFNSCCIHEAYLRTKSIPKMAQQEMNISLDESKESEVYRGASAVVRSNINMDQGLDMGMNPMSGKASSHSKTQQFGGNSKSIMTLEPDSAQSKGSKTANYSKIEVVPDAQQEVSISAAVQYNEISSTLVPGMDCATALQQLSGALSAYSQEIEFSVDSTKANAPEITDGVVFVDNYYAVHFKVYIFPDAQTDGVRMEFRRKSGNALAAAKFLGEINTAFNLKTHSKRESTGNLFVDAVIAATEQAVRDSLSQSSMSKDIEMVNGGGDTMIALDTNFDGLELKMNEDQAERMMIHEALIADDVVGDLDESAENYLFQKLRENGAISKEIVDHDMLCQALMQRQTLLHRDVAVVRASFLVLRNLVATHSKMMQNAKFLSVVEEAMKGAHYGLTKKYALSFLSALAAVDGAWGLGESTKASLKGLVEGVQAGMKGQNVQGSKGFDFAADIDFAAILDKL